MNRILITGITGYIGSCLARQLLPDCEVHGLVREPLNLMYLSDIRRQLRLHVYDGTPASVSAALESSRPDTVFHLAAYYTGAHGPEVTPALIASNITFGAYLLESMAGGGSRLVFADTIMAHDGGGAYRPLNLYAATKRAFSDLTAYYTGTGLLQAAAVVLSDTYGPGDRRPKVLNLLRQSILEGTALPLTSGRQVYNAVYIDDVVRGFQKAAAALEDAAAAHRFFQLSAENPCSLRETVQRMLEVNHLDYRPDWGGRPDPDVAPECPLHMFPAPPGWRPLVSLEDGLRRFWNSALPEGGDGFG